ncbi:MAG TPA: helix-turn-helix transcriptional regulator [Sphingorhabdus sp.]|nr:helix-turn-helix transcriptional regulator [uncultured Sphingorhabdus sp.]HMS20509.1 helix-turn-helix transcriptional regulator [Sphingorhabdus sp.]
MLNDIKQLRTAKGWSQDYLSFRLGCSRQHVVNIEKGKHDPSLELAMQIARLFRRPVEAIFHPLEKALRSCEEAVAESAAAIEETCTH